MQGARNVVAVEHMAYAGTNNPERWLAELKKHLVTH